MTEKNIAAVRPVDWELMTKYFNSLHSEETPIYPGSVVDTCECCKIAVYVGPKMQEAFTEHRADYELMCFICAAKDYYAQQQAGHDVEVRQMGNTNTGRPDAQPEA